MPYLEWKTEISSLLSSAVGGSSESWYEQLAPAPKLELGHFALPCFRMAKEQKKAPPAVAAELAAKIKHPTITASVAGPYLNFTVNPNRIVSETLAKIEQEKANYGSDQTGKNKKILIEYCSPNIAKRLAFQHLRSTLIGNTLANIYRVLGYETLKMNFVGDWGTQFAKLVAAIETWAPNTDWDKMDPAQVMQKLFDLYVRFHQEEAGNAQLEQKASQFLQEMEKGNPRLLSIWKSVRAVSLQEVERTLERIQVRFDVVEGESEYVENLLKDLEKVKKQSGAVLSEGAWIVEVEGLPVPALIQKRDGTTIYLTRDIAAAISRYQRHQFTESLYVVGEQQKLHFQQLFGVLKKMKEPCAEKCMHVTFGTVMFGKEKMSTREGRVIFLEDLLKEAHKRALEECTIKNPELKNKEEVAERVGIGAVIFAELSTHRTRDMEFDWKKILAFEGDTGPYVQYAAVRCQSLMEKAGWKSKGGYQVDKNYVPTPEEHALSFLLAQYRQVLHQCVREKDPFFLTNYLIDIARALNRFYYENPVLQAEAKVQEFRLNLVQSAFQVLLNAMTLLGMKCPKEM